MLLERILLNLCANAVRYTVHGGVILAARVRGSLVRIEVWDTGIGISAEQQCHVFEEFYQIGGAPDERGKGLGLGLAIVDRLGRLLDLPVSIRSVPGRGSVFAVGVALAHAAQQGEPAVPQLLAPARFEGLSVLLIDDDPIAREAIGGLLTQWGCEVRSSACAAGALRQVADGSRPRLIICDYHLGDHERGTSVVRQVRELAREDIPSVILSADTSNALREATATAGLHLLHKPLNAARLRALLLHVARS